MRDDQTSAGMYAMNGIDSICKSAVLAFFKIAIYIAYKAYRIEGLNALYYFMPSKLIVSTLQKYGARIGKNVIISPSPVIHNAKRDYANLEIGDNAYLGRGVFLDLTEKIKIGNRTVISMRVNLLTHFDVGPSILREILPPKKGATTIEDDAYVGAASTIREGIKVGKGAVVAAMSFVNEDVDEDTIVGGVPAHRMGSLKGGSSIE